MNLKFNPDHPWAKLPRWEKRINGFLSYMLSAFVALRHPEIADIAVYKELKQQFIEDR